MMSRNLSQRHEPDGAIKSVVPPAEVDGPDELQDEKIWRRLNRIALPATLQSGLEVLETVLGPQLATVVLAYRLGRHMSNCFGAPLLCHDLTTSCPHSDSFSSSSNVLDLFLSSRRSVFTSAWCNTRVPRPQHDGRPIQAYTAPWLGYFELGRCVDDDTILAASSVMERVQESWKHWCCSLPHVERHAPWLSRARQPLPSCKP